MPENNQPVNTTTITLPPGMTKEAFLKSFASFNKMKDYTAKRDKCVRNAFTALKAQYPNDYTRLLNAELKKAGLPVK